jgi:hypothetical protein
MSTRQAGRTPARAAAIRRNGDAVISEGMVRGESRSSTWTELRRLAWAGQHVLVGAWTRSGERGTFSTPRVVEGDHKAAVPSPAGWTHVGR